MRTGIIAKLDVQPPFVAKPVHFEGLRKTGKSSDQGADEVRYIDDCCRYMDISLQEYHDALVKFRSPHLWEKNYGKWELKQPIWKDK